MIGPIGYFVHHQGRGHAERAAAIVNALPVTRPVTLFSARDDIFPPLRAGVNVRKIPSLFEPIHPFPENLQQVRTPSTLHCAPLGWPSITEAISTISSWFQTERPVLFMTDVSAELAQLARIASIPCVPVLQHGDRDDPGHMSAYEGAVGILAPYSETLEQPGRPDWMQLKTFHAPGIGIESNVLDKATARSKLGLDDTKDIVLVIAGGGGEGTPATPLSLGARAEPDTLWITIGKVMHEWHDTAPSNLIHRGWVDNASLWIAAADRIVSSAGNTTVHQIASAGRPWIVVPEWRYFAEQLWKARMLSRAGAATLCEHWPSSAGAWQAAWAAAADIDMSRQHALVDDGAPAATAKWIEDLITHCWNDDPVEAMAAQEKQQCQ